MLIDNKFNIGDKVYLDTDSEQHERIVTGFTVRQNSIIYAISKGSSESWHYDFEITTEKDVVKQTTN